MSQAYSCNSRTTQRPKLDACGSQRTLRVLRKHSRAIRGVGRPNCAILPDSFSLSCDARACALFWWAGVQGRRLGLNPAKLESIPMLSSLPGFELASTTTATTASTSTTPTASTKTFNFSSPCVIQHADVALVFCEHSGRCVFRFSESSDKDHPLQE